MAKDEEVSFSMTERDLATLMLDHLTRDVLHGIPLEPDYKEVIPTYIELAPRDALKFEVDKNTGLLFADRCHRFSSVPPCFYGYVPQTYCGERTAQYFKEHIQDGDYRGDGDPLDIGVFVSAHIRERGFLMNARPIGVLNVLDGKEVDYKIVAVMEPDPAFEKIRDLSDLRSLRPDRWEALHHYFGSYKNEVSKPPVCQVIPSTPDQEGVDAARAIIRLAHEDYREKYAERVERIERLQKVVASDGS